MKLIEPILQFQDELKQIRRTIHAHPELAYEETQTSQLVAQQLEAWGIPVIRGLGGTGVVGVIRAGSSSRAVGLRADMDALPLQEHNQFPTALSMTGKCTPVATTDTLRCSLGPRIIFRNIGILTGRFMSSFNPLRKAVVAPRR